MKVLGKLFAVSIICCFLCAVTVHADNKYEVVRQVSAGEAVQRVQIRLYELGFLHFKPTGSFKGMTVKATIAFQQMQVTDTGGYVAADGEAGEQTQSILFSARAKRAAIPADVNIPIGPSLKGTPAVKGTLMTWDKVKSMLIMNNSYKVFDFNTGKSYRVKYSGGENHAEVECLTAEDTAKFLETAGGRYNFSKRPVVLQIDDETLIAGSVYCYPHGADYVIDNEMTGHICIFFDGSRAHVGNVTDVEHQKQIYTAAGM